MPKRKKCPEEKIRKLEKKLKKYKEQMEREEEDSVQEVVPETELECPDFDIPEEASCDDEEALIAEALGEPVSDNGYGEDIHPNLASVMTNILEKGLSKPEKDKLLEINIPSNCTLLDAPKLNMEFSAILTAAAKSRDKLLKDRQQELGQSVSNIVQAINVLSQKDFNKTEVIRKLGEASRLICNLHFQYTNIRRKLINPFLDKSLTENLQQNKRGENLYTNLEESVKSFSAIKRATNLIKPKGAVVNKGRNNHYNNAKATKNYQPPLRQYQNRQNKKGAYFQRNQHHQPQKTYKPSDKQYQPGPSNRGRVKYP